MLDYIPHKSHKIKIDIKDSELYVTIYELSIKSIEELNQGNLSVFDIVKEYSNLSEDDINNLTQSMLLQLYEAILKLTFGDETKDNNLKKKPI